MPSLMHGLVTIATLLWALICFGEHPLTPSDVLSRAEIADIIQRRDFFRYRSLDLETPIWMSTRRQYSSAFFQDRTHCFTLDDVLHHTLTDSFEIRYQLERLYRGKLAIHAAVGRALPNFSPIVGGGAPPLTLSSAFANLYGFVLPQNWLQVASEQRVYKATKYLLLRTVLDEMLDAKLAYIRQHQAIQDLETISFYLIHLQMLMEITPPDTLASSILFGRVGFEGTRMAGQREEVRLGFDNLALVMALDRVDGHYSADQINIADLTGFPQTLADFDQLDDVYRDKELFLEQVIRRSVELKAVKEFYAMSQLNVGIVATGGTLFNIDNLQGQPLFGIRLGYDTLPTILIAQSLSKTARIDVQREFINMLDNARRSFDYYTNALQTFVEAKQSLAQNRYALIRYIGNNVYKDRGVQHVLVLILAQTLEAEVRLTEALHGYLRAKAYMDRFLLVDSDGALNYLPSRGKILEIFHDVKGQQLAELRKDEFIDFQLEHIRKAEHLASILYEPERHPELASYSPADIEAAVRRNIGGLLYSKLFFHKSRRFYRILASYLAEHGIELTNTESYILKKRQASLWTRLVHRKRIFADDPFELLDFENFRVDPHPPTSASQDDEIGGLPAEAPPLWVG